MTDFQRLPDVAGRALGGSVMYANDEFFAEAHNLITQAPATHDPAAFGPRGKVYDGWETRRRRGEPGDDFVIVRLAAPAVLRGVVVDTGFFRGNHPPYASVAATTVLGYPSAEELHRARWRPLVEKAGLAGDTANAVPVSAPDQLATHLRLTIHPDGGVARFRAHGEVVPDPRRLGGRVDLASVLHGGLVEDCSNLFFSAPGNVLMPGRSVGMFDGWETARRRDDGNDWLQVRLGVPGVVRQVVLDTGHFVGNSPGSARLTDSDTGADLVPEARLQPDTAHHFAVRVETPARRVRLDIYPDGGLSRLRVLGEVPEHARADLARRWLGLLPEDVAAGVDRAEFFA
ncbi:MAG TPA: allantoicase [Pseudonocardia sp.]|jgi:allantoicase